MSLYGDVSVSRRCAHPALRASPVSPLIRLTSSARPRVAARAAQPSSRAQLEQQAASHEATAAASPSSAGSWEQLARDEEVVLRGMLSSGRMPVIAALATVEAPPETSTSTTPKAAGKSKWTIDESENLRSTPEHRLWTFGSMAIMATTFSQGLMQANGPADWCSIAAAMTAAYVLSDLGTGIYHWSVDNYGDGQTPFVGRQIAAFQGHHQRPWTITKREFCNNLHQVFKPAAYPAALFLLLSPWTPAWLDSFSSLFIFLVCMSQQFHAWSHMKKSELPEVVLQLQAAGVLISRKAHGAHHRVPFEGNYCIVSGLWNEPLDNSGFFRGLEKVVLAVTGVEPRCWHEPEYEIEEETVNPSLSM